METEQQKHCAMEYLWIKLEWDANAESARFQRNFDGSHAYPFFIAVHIEIVDRNSSESPFKYDGI